MNWWILYVVTYPVTWKNLIQNTNTPNTNEVTIHPPFCRSLCSSRAGWGRCFVLEISGWTSLLQLLVCPHCDMSHRLHLHCCPTAYTGDHHSHMLENNIVVGPRWTPLATSSHVPQRLCGPSCLLWSQTSSGSHSNGSGGFAAGWSWPASLAGRTWDSDQSLAYEDQSHGTPSCVNKSDQLSPTDDHKRDKRQRQDGLASLTSHR